MVLDWNVDDLWWLQVYKKGRVIILASDSVQLPAPFSVFLCEVPCGQAPCKHALVIWRGSQPGDLKVAESMAQPASIDQPWNNYRWTGSKTKDRRRFQKIKITWWWHSIFCILRAWLMIWIPVEVARPDHSHSDCFCIDTDTPVMIPSHLPKYFNVQLSINKYVNKSRRANQASLLSICWEIIFSLERFSDRCCQYLAVKAGKV